MHRNHKFSKQIQETLHTTPTLTQIVYCVRVMSLRMGQNRLNAHMYMKMKLAPSSTCNRCLEGQTAEHILQRCPLLQTASTNVWPTAVQLHTKVYGSRRSWRRRLQSSFRLDSQCSGDREEEESSNYNQATRAPATLSDQRRKCGKMS